MPEKPTTASGYPPGQVARVKSTCLYLATKLGDLMDELVVVPLGLYAIERFSPGKRTA